MDPLFSTPYITSRNRRKTHVKKHLFLDYEFDLDSSDDS